MGAGRKGLEGTPGGRPSRGRRLNRQDAIIPPGTDLEQPATVPRRPGNKETEMTDKMYKTVLRPIKEPK